MRLHNEHVGAAYGLVETAADLAVGKLDQVGIAQLDVQVGGHLLCERGMCAPGV